jgi:predicted nucleic acid-binding protein
MIAVDTNVLVYRLDRHEPAKRAIAKRLLRQLAADGDTVLMWQVAGELLRQLSAWRRAALLTTTELTRRFDAIRRQFPLVLPMEASLHRAILYAERYVLSHWDSMLVAACAEAEIFTLYTEDMGAPRKIDLVQLINPFAVP